MTPRLLEILGCPYDRSPLVEDFPEGLSCPECLRGFPVIRGIPRMLPDELMGELEPEFFARNAAWWKSKAHPDAAVEASAARRTLKSFGYQWTRFVDRPDKVWEGDFAQYLHPLKPEDFQGRLVLDAGCGNGRFLHVARQCGAEAVGLDLSAAVESAAQVEGALVVQGSVLRPPFRIPFDLVYSIGVLHHLPEGTEAGVKALSALLKPGGRLAIWVYSTRRIEEKRLRGIAARLPLPLLRLASLALAARIRLRGFKGWEMYRDYPFKVLWTDVFDMLAPPVERQHDGAEVEGWLRASGLAPEHLGHIDAFQGWRALGKKEGA